MTATIGRLRTDPAVIAEFVDRISQPGEVREVRIPDSRRGPARLFGLVSGYFDNGDDLARALQRLTGDDAEAVYITLNAVNPELFARAVNRLKEKVKTTTSDDD